MVCDPLHRTRGPPAGGTRHSLAFVTLRVYACCVRVSAQARTALFGPSQCVGTTACMCTGLTLGEAALLKGLRCCQYARDIVISDDAAWDAYKQHAHAQLALRFVYFSRRLDWRSDLDFRRMFNNLESDQQ